MGNHIEECSSPKQENLSYTELGPYQRLFNAVLPNPQGAIPLERVDEIIAAIPGIIERELTPKEKSVIEKRYLKEKVVSVGHGEKKKSKEEKDEEKVEIKALRKLAHPNKGLGKYKPLTESSIARNYLGASLVEDIGLGFKIDFQRLPKEDQAVIIEDSISHVKPISSTAAYLNRQTSQKIATEPLGKEESLASKVSGKGRMIIAEQLMNYLRTSSQTKEIDVYVLAQNRLLPIFIPKETLQKLALLRFGDTEAIMSFRLHDVLALAGKKTLGQVLLLRPSDLVKIKRLGPQRALELGNFFQKILDPKGEKYDPGFLGEELKQAYLKAKE